jgi:hypothetical protein
MRISKQERIAIFSSLRSRVARNAEQRPCPKQDRCHLAALFSAGSACPLGAGGFALVAPPDAGLPEPPYRVLGFHPVPVFRSPLGLSLRGPVPRVEDEPANFFVLGRRESDAPSGRGEYGRGGREPEPVRGPSKERLAPAAGR